MNVIQTVISVPTLVLNSSDKIYDALDKMLERELSTCPVVDHNGKFLGQITDVIFIKALILIRSGKKLDYIFELSEYFLNPPTISSFSSIEEVATKIFSSKSQRIFVVDSTNKLQGVISPKNVLKFLAMEFGYISSGESDGKVTKEQQILADLKEIQQKYNTANERKTAFEKVLETADSLVLIFDSELKLFFVNKTAVESLGLKLDPSGELTLKEVLSEQSFREVTGFLDQCQKEQSDFHLNSYFSLNTAAGDEFRIEANVNISCRNDGFISLIGKNINADKLLKQLNGIYG